MTQSVYVKPREGKPASQNPIHLRSNTVINQGNREHFLNRGRLVFRQTHRPGWLFLTKIVVGKPDYSQLQLSTKHTGVLWWC